MTFPNEMLEELRAFDTPTICNALECYKLRGNTEGILSSKIQEILGYDRPFIGYACTAKLTAAAPGKPDEPSCLEEYYRVLRDQPGPKIAVIEDIDPEPIGSFWGEVNCHIHMALGAVATVTNGGVRDLREVHPMGFGFYAICKLTSHGYNHLIECNKPVQLFGVTINPGDILFCDQYGVIILPPETIPTLANTCRKIAAAELPVIQNCKRYILEGKLAAVDDLMRWRSEMSKLRRQAGPSGGANE